MKIFSSLLVSLSQQLCRPLSNCNGFSRLDKRKEMWSATEYPVHRAVTDFHEALYSSPVALRRLQDFHDDDKITEVAQHEKARILEEFTTKNFNLEETLRERLLEGLEKRLDINISRYLERNRSKKQQSGDADAVTKIFMDFQVKNFKSSANIHLSVNPKMELMDFDKLLENEKREISTTVSGMLEECVGGLQKELREKHEKYLKEGKKLLGQVKTDFRKMSKHLVVEAKKFTKNNASKGDLEVIVEDMRNDLLGKGSRLKECHPNVYDKLLGVLNEAMQFILEKGEHSGNEPTSEGNQSTWWRNTFFPENIIPWATKLDRDLRECFVGTKDIRVPNLEGKGKSSKHSAVQAPSYPVMTRLRGKAIAKDSSARDSKRDTVAPKVDNQREMNDQVHVHMENEIAKEEDIISVAVLEFHDWLHCSFPLLHFYQFYEEDKIRHEADLQKTSTLEKFSRRIPSPSVNKLRLELEKIIDEWVAKNADHKSQTDSFLQKWNEFLCETFKSSVETKLEMNPGMEMKSLNDILVKGKSAAISYFEFQCIHKNVTSNYNREGIKNLEKGLDNISKDITELQRSYLNLDEVKNTVLKMKIKPSKTDMAAHGNDIEMYCNAFMVTDQDSPAENAIIPERMELDNAKTGEFGIIDAVDGCTEFRKEMVSNKRVADWPAEFGQKISNLRGVKVSSNIVNRSTPKRIKLDVRVCSCEDGGALVPSVNEINVPDAKGYVPLLRAIEEGRCVSCIAKIIESGADVNVKANNCFKDNAAHTVFRAKRFTPTHALDILNLLITKGFNLINDRSSSGFYTPLHEAMHCTDINEDILKWFHENGADFNALTDTQASVLQEAVCNYQGAEIVQKILEFGGDPHFNDMFYSNALVCAATHANMPAMKILLDHANIIIDKVVNYPHHYLFMRDGLDYLPCLELLLEKRAKFEEKFSTGYVPLAAWMQTCEANPFPALMKLKDRIPITKKMASDTLTAIMKKIERLEKFLPSSSQEGPNDFTQFIIFLINEKDAELQFDEDWKQKFGNNLLIRLEVRPRICQKLRTTGSINCGSEFLQLKCKTLGKLVFDIESSAITGPVEFALTCLLVHKKYRRFVEMREYLRDLSEVSKSDSEGKED